MTTPTSHEELREEFYKEFSVWNNKWIFAERKLDQNTATTEDVANWWLEQLSQREKQVLEEITDIISTSIELEGRHKDHLLDEIDQFFSPTKQDNSIEI